MHAVDVGAGQLDWKLRTDPRVVVHEGINARHLQFEDIGEPVDLATLRRQLHLCHTDLAGVAPILRSGARMVILVKPQFEVGKGQVGRRYRASPELHREACARVDAAVKVLGFETSIMDSPISARKGTRSFCLYARH